MTMELTLPATTRSLPDEEPRPITRGGLVSSCRRERAEWERARKLVELYGSDTLAYFALREDKHFFFGSDGKAMIAYAVSLGTAIVSGDPIGEAGSTEAVFDEFRAFARSRGWRVAILAAREDRLALYRSRGLRSFYIGDEAIVDCKRFSLSGSKMRPVRLPVNKLTKRGYSFELVAEHEAPAETIRELDDVSQSQHALEDEVGFTMGLSTRVTGGHVGMLLAIARNPEGRIEGFMRFAPCAGTGGGYSLDLMRRAPDAGNGVNEFVIANTALALGERGVERLSLNFSAVRRYLLKDADLDARERLVRWLLCRMEWLLPVRSLVQWNKKFRPDWSSLYIVHEPRGLARAGLIYVMAEGFIRLPGLGRLRMARVRQLEGSAR